MKYEVYTDGACNHRKGVIASAFFIRTKSSYVGINSAAYRGDNIAIAESLALGIACEFLLNSSLALNEKDSVTIYTDSTAVVEFFQDFKDDEARPATGDERVRLTWSRLRELDAKCCVDIRKFKAHIEGFNGNKVADRLAKHCLRRVVDKI